MTQQLLDIETFPKDSAILEPAAGDYAIAKVLMKNGYEVICKDISTGEDFLKEAGTYDCLVTNPPFSIGLPFVLKAKQVCKQKFAMLFPLYYLHGKQRYDQIWQDREFPLSHVYVFARYPLLGDKLREDGKYKTGMMVYAWYVWSRSPIGNEPIIRWIDNSNYVIGKNHELEQV